MAVVYGMEGCILIAPGNTELGEQLAKRALQSGMKVVCTTSKGEENSENSDSDRTDDDYTDSDPLAGVPADDNSLFVPLWHSRSLLSARNVLLGGLNTFGGIDTAVLIHSGYASNQALHEVSPVGIEKAVDSHIKGHFFMLKEVLGHFLKQQGGTLAMAIHSPEDYVPSPLDAAAIAGFRALTDSLFAIYQNENIDIRAFESAHKNADRYAEYILETIENRSGISDGKWYHFGDGPLRIRRRSRM